MMHHLFNGEGQPEVPGTACAGSSEAVMLGALAMKWRWKARRETASQNTDRPNLVYGADVHVVWDKFCRYFDVEPRQVPLARGRYSVTAEDLERHIDENTIGVVAVVGTTFTGDCDDVVGIDAMLHELAGRGLEVPLHIDAASGGFVFPFSHPDFEWDFRLESVKSINVSGHKFGTYFFSLDWSSAAAVAAARRGYLLPYFRAEVSLEPREGKWRFSSRRAASNGRLAPTSRATYTPCGPPLPVTDGSLERWLTERQCLYVVRRGRVLSGEIHHRPWPLRTASGEIGRNSMADPLGLKLQADPLLHFAERQDTLLEDRRGS
jgi:Pyridoxal-dependent decarboxylase conserved domain/Uncharacterized conserved protein (COG2071)